MKFAKGLVIGGLLATGVLMMYSESDMLNKNKKNRKNYFHYFFRKPF